MLLPIALMSTRSTPIRKHKLTPHEINTGRLMAIPGNSVQCTKKMDLNPKNCYVCGFIPHSTREGLPLMALPASSCDTCHILHFNSPKEHCTCPSLSQNRLYYTAMTAMDWRPVQGVPCLRPKSAGIGSSPPATLQRIKRRT